MNDRSLMLRNPVAFAFTVIAAMAAWRFGLLAFAAPNLSFDEAQYWAWAQTLQLGYYSKPPMVAWAIAATTAACGEGAGCVKLGAAIAQTATAVVMFFLGRRLFGPRVGAWAACLWATMPAVSLSSLMITTDPFLLFFWSLSLLFLIKAAERGAGVNRWWVLLGLAMGLGLLSKYAMAFFLLSVALFVAWSREHRALVKGGGLWLAVALMLAVYAPNAIWNATNGFVSYAHTKANAHLGGGSLVHPDKMAEFVIGQLGVFGPIAMAALVAALFGALRRPEDSRFRLLAAFTLPVLAVMVAESLLSRANANWSAPAYVAGTVLAAAFMARRWPRLLVAAFALNLGIAGVMYNLDAVRAGLGLPDVARFDPMKRIRAWDQVGEQVSAILAAHPGARLMGDERKLMATLTYYVTPHPFDAVKWNPDGNIDDHFDQTTRLEAGQPLLIYVTERDALEPGMAERFASAEKLADIRIPVHRDYVRKVAVWKLADFKGYAP
jgi:4-amino-4-deoxy-L-arabinose transferase-like glycosyltransferase